MEFKLTNLRELSTEEQVRLNGGSFPMGCDIESCYCTCLCGDDEADKNSFTEMCATREYELTESEVMAS